MSKKKFEVTLDSTKIMLVAIIAVLVVFIIVKAVSTNNAVQVSNAAGVPVADQLQAMVGKKAPTFTLKNGNGDVFTNDSVKGKRVVLFFNEGLMCYPACWNQMVELAKDDRFKKDDTVVLSVVVDSQANWKNAIAKMPDLGLVNAAFESTNAAKSFNMLTAKSTMHTGSLPGHSYVIIDKNGIVRYVLDDPNMAINNDKIFTEWNKLGA